MKVTALTRLVVSLYAFSALALMLHMQLHILGERVFMSRHLAERRSAIRQSILILHRRNLGGGGGAPGVLWVLWGGGGVSRSVTGSGVVFFREMRIEVNIH